MADNRIINDKYREIAQELIDTEPELDYIKQSDVRIVYLSSDYKKVAKGRKVNGQCEKVKDSDKWAKDCDFTITVFEPNVVGWTDEKLRILLFHELLHVGVEQQLDGTVKCSINEHDYVYEDFSIIVDRYGMEWAQ